MKITFCGPKRKSALVRAIQTKTQEDMETKMDEKDDVGG